MLRGFPKEVYGSIVAVSEGYFDEVPAAKIKDAQADLLARLWTNHKDYLN